MNFAWEIARNNMEQQLRSDAPFRFTIIDAQTTANILALAIGLLLARLQYSRATRPLISMAIDDEGAQFNPKTATNGGFGCTMQAQEWPRSNTSVTMSNSWANRRSMTSITGCIYQ
ncbi:hypothetical protein [Nonomuraea sp. JJY05]|uniref:hypothetical protein n=1 Tax=Nonomuraea sp. JJY05 TaxID=3350255 RepID=UPI00373F0472